MKSQEIQDVRNRVTDLLARLNDPVSFPCLKHEGVELRTKPSGDDPLSGPPVVVPVPRSCILKQYADNEKEGRQGFFPDIMCPTCRLLWLATQAEKDLTESVRVEQMREADVAKTNVWKPRLG